MQLDFSKISLIYPKVHDFSALLAERPLPPFSDEMMLFLQELSSKLLHDASAKKYPDVVTFGFWCRKKALLALEEQYKNNMARLGRGVVFHITPSNVPVNFAYSLAAGLLSGNINIVRVPTNNFPQVEIICSAICSLLEQDEFGNIKNRIALLRYHHDDATTSFFSKNAEVRIIWGGDDAINEIRKAQLPPRSFDVTFADRYSLCVINADEFTKDNKPEAVANDFYNDTYLFDQNACTSPHLVIWIGEEKNISSAKRVFWSELHKIVKGKYNLEPILAIDKYVSFCRFAIEHEKAFIEAMPDNLIVRIGMDVLPKNIDEYHGKAGLFFEYNIKSMDEIAHIVNRKYQTLSYYGIQKNVFSSFVLSNRAIGIDRIVPIGKTTEFSLIWDGYDLICTLTRIIS